MVVFILQDKYVVCDNQALFTLERIYSGINVIFAKKNPMFIYSRVFPLPSSFITGILMSLFQFF